MWITSLIACLTTLISSLATLFATSCLESRKRKSEWQSKQREIKFLKLAELWLAVNLAKDRLYDTEIHSRVGDQILPPPAKDLASSATSAAFGIALMHFPEMRRPVYALHVETRTYEHSLWFHRSIDEDATVDRITTAITKVADAVEKTASDLQQR